MCCAVEEGTKLQVSESDHTRVQTKTLVFPSTMCENSPLSASTSAPPVPVVLITAPQTNVSHCYSP